MTVRTSIRRIQFARPFRLAGIAAELPPGEYEVTTDEELIGGMTTQGWRRVATTMLISGRGVTQRYVIDPADLEANLAQDAVVSVFPTDGT
jgi:hypothetical protein